MLEQPEHSISPINMLTIQQRLIRRRGKGLNDTMMDALVSSHLVIPITLAITIT